MLRAHTVMCTLTLQALSIFWRIMVIRLPPFLYPLCCVRQSAVWVSEERHTAWDRKSKQMALFIEQIYFWSGNAVWLELSTRSEIISMMARVGCDRILSGITQQSKVVLLWEHKRRKITMEGYTNDIKVWVKINNLKQWFNIILH